MSDIDLEFAGRFGYRMDAAGSEEAGAAQPEYPEFLDRLDGEFAFQGSDDDLA